MPAAAARRIQTAVLRHSAAAAPRSPAALPLLWASPRKEVCKVFGLPQLSYLRLQKSPMCASPPSGKDGLVYSGNLKEIELRILKLEAADSFYNDVIWKFLCPLLGLGFLMSVPSAINVFNGVSTLKQGQRDIDDELSKLEKRIALLESEELDEKVPRWGLLQGPPFMASIASPCNSCGLRPFQQVRHFCSGGNIKDGGMTYSGACSSRDE
ncbi:hypothetical protein ACP70R_048194 [Stipagrostis hirtigluma subsp. patula]